jgi:hypothetical protein
MFGIFDLHTHPCILRKKRFMFGNPLHSGGDLFIIIAVLMIAFVTALVNLDVLRSISSKSKDPDKKTD